VVHLGHGIVAVPAAFAGDDPGAGERAEVEVALLAVVVDLLLVVPVSIGSSKHRGVVRPQGDGHALDTVHIPSAEDRASHVAGQRRVELEYPIDLIVEVPSSIEIVRSHLVVVGGCEHDQGATRVGGRRGDRRVIHD
jgi:hypothetical protein